MRERVTVVTLSVTRSVFHSGEGAICRVETDISIHSRRRFKCFKCSTFFENRCYFGEKASGTSAVIAVMYAGNAQSSNGLACDLLARGTLYQSSHLRCSCVGFVPSRSCRFADCFPFQQIVS